MLVSAIPREDMNSVSTRVHYYYYLQNLPREWRWEPFSGQFGDVLYVQKKADDRTLRIAQNAKGLRVPIVYDCDDNPYKKKGKDRIRMLELADAVTTDTPGRAAQLKKLSGISQVYVIPECVDYYDRMKPVPIREKPRRLITFGNNSNAVHCAKYMKYSTLNCYHINSKPIPGAGEFIKWRLQTFIDEMCKADICILAHNDGLKSDLKALVCVAMGMPVIVSNTTAYGDLMRAMDLEWLIMKDHKDIRRVLNRLSPRQTREEVVEKYKNYDMSDRTPKAAAKKLAEVFEHVCTKSI